MTKIRILYFLPMFISNSEYQLFKCESHTFTPSYNILKVQHCGEWLLFSGHLLAVGENHRSVITLVIIHRGTERAFVIGRYESAAMLISLNEAAN